MPRSPAVTTISFKNSVPTAGAAVDRHDDTVFRDSEYAGDCGIEDFDHIGVLAIGRDAICPEVH